MTGATAMATHQERQGIISWAGNTYGVEASKVMAVLKATCFKTSANEPEASDAEVAGLLVVARAHNLNPFLREIFAFRNQNGGIVPVVGIDGWSRIINDNEHMDGLEFAFDGPEGAPKWCQCTIHRKDRKNPTVITEYFSECHRDTKPWKSHPRRMLRHKAMIQCARVAFGFAGIYDEDEAERIIERDVTPRQPQEPLERGAGAKLREAVAESAKPLPGDASGLKTGGETPENTRLDPERIIKAAITEGMAAKVDRELATDTSEAEIRGEGKPTMAKTPGTPKQRKDYLRQMAAEKDANELNLIFEDVLTLHDWPKADAEELAAAYNRRAHELKG